MAGESELVDVRIVAVDREVWAGKAGMLVATTTEGELGVLAGHAPLLGQLVDESSVKIYPDGATEEPQRAFEITGGYLSVTEDGVSVLVETATELKHG